MSAEPIAGQPAASPSDASELGLLVVMAVIVLLGVVAMLAMAG